LVRLQDGLLPEVILSECSMPLLKAVSTLGERQQFCGRQITHIYDPQRIVSKIRQSLIAARKPVPVPTLDKMAKLIGRLVETKCQQEYEECFK